MRTVSRNRATPRLSPTQRVLLHNQRALTTELTSGVRSPSVTPDGIVGREFVYHVVQNTPGWVALLHGGLLFDPCQEDAVLISPGPRGQLVVRKGPMDVTGWLADSRSAQDATALECLRLLDAAYDDGHLQVSLWALSQALDAAARMLAAFGPSAITPDWTAAVPAEPLGLQHALATRNVSPWGHCT